MYYRMVYLFESICPKGEFYIGYGTWHPLNNASDEELMNRQILYNTENGWADIVDVEISENPFLMEESK